MKKIVIASLIALSAVSANALEVGITESRDYAGANRNGVGITVGQTFGRFGATTGIEKFTQGKNDQNRYSLIGSYGVGAVGPSKVSFKGGVAYLDNQRGADGSAWVVGAGVAIPVTTKVSATLDLTRQFGQDRVKSFDGNKVTAGLTYSF
jgi:outer membrane autotransporter protein